MLGAMSGHVRPTRADFILNAAGRLPVRELEVEVGLLDGWARFWHRGELLPLPADLQRQLDDLQTRLKQAQRQARQEKKRAEQDPAPSAPSG